MTTLHIFTEETSAKKVFDHILPKLLPKNASYRIYPHQGKQDLEKALRNTVPSISKIPGSKIMITRDQDSSDCHQVKRSLEEITELNCSCEYKIRIACRQLENWFLGDLEAIRQTYPRFRPDNYQNKAYFRDVDNISSADTFLLKIIPELKRRSTLPKIIVAESIAPHLNLDNNKSKSFNHTLKAIKSLFENV